MNIFLLFHIVINYRPFKKNNNFFLFFFLLLALNIYTIRKNESEENNIINFELIIRKENNNM